MKPFQHLAIRYDGKFLEVLDQRLLPDVESWIRIDSPVAMKNAIQSLAVRGAPLIGVAAAISIALFRRKSNPVEVYESGMALRGARASQGNLTWAMDRMLRTPELREEVLLQSAEKILSDEVTRCESMADFGSDIIQTNEGILTLCNTGALSTVGIGTAMGAIRRAHERGKKIHVYVCETRPLLQGARLTTWELDKLEIPYTLICDSMIGSLMREGKIQRVLVGAERIALNGDFSNVIGTYTMAVNALYHQIPFYVVAPISTIDFHAENGNVIPIEERKPEEVRGISYPLEFRWSTRGAPVWQKACDVTPREFLTGMVLNTGVYTQSMLREGALEELRS